MKVQVIADDCISCGLCVNSVPAVFEWDDSEKAVAMTDHVPEKLEAEVEDAIDSCPTDAIEEV